VVRLAVNDGHAVTSDRAVDNVRGARRRALPVKDINRLLTASFRLGGGSRSTYSGAS
jgi:hypothetical protein